MLVSQMVPDGKSRPVYGLAGQDGPHSLDFVHLNLPSREYA
jgi:hypothetical protein